MARISPKVECSPEDLKEITQLASRPKTEQRLALRANIILKCLEGWANTKIAKEFNITALTVKKWRTRFIKLKMEGLYDAPRSGKPKRYNDEDVRKILKLLEESPPKGQSTWDGNSVAKQLNLSHDFVWRVLRKEGIQLLIR